MAHVNNIVERSLDRIIPRSYSAAVEPDLEMPDYYLSSDEDSEDENVDLVRATQTAAAGVFTNEASAGAIEEGRRSGTDHLLSRANRDALVADGANAQDLDRGFLLLIEAGLLPTAPR